MGIFEKRTKIVATMGPACEQEAQIEELIRLGVNVFRFNMKHNTVAWHEERIARVDKIAKQMKTKVGILIDLQGPELRIETKGKGEIRIEKDQVVRFGDSFKSEEDLISIPHAGIYAQMKPGDIVLIDDGFLEFEVVEAGNDYFTARAYDSYVVKNRKGVNLPGKEIDLPSLIDADLDKLDMATRIKVDFVALSFCRSAKDVEILKDEMIKRGLVAQVVAKIESQEALHNINEIIVAADAIMVARGDLGVEVPIEKLTFWQKQIIKMCRQNHKPVIVATQMLQSMVDNPRPTRAEATDVSNAVWDGTDAIMLSGETASGKYPLKAVEAMARIAKYNEENATLAPIVIPNNDPAEAVVTAVMQVVQSHSNIDAIVVFTETGYTAKVVSSFRPAVPVIAVTATEKTLELLTLSFGVQTVVADMPMNGSGYPTQVIEYLRSEQAVRSGDQVLLIHGQHWRHPGSTNTMSLVRV